MARLHSFYISNAQQELNYVGKNLSDEAFNEVMQSYINSFTSDSDMFIDEVDDNNDGDDDPFESLVPEEEEENNDLLTDNDLDLLVGNLINLNHIEKEIEPEEVDHGEVEFNVDDILAKVNCLNN